MVQRASTFLPPQFAQRVFPPPCSFPLLAVPMTFPEDPLVRYLAMVNWVRYALSNSVWVIPSALCGFCGLFSICLYFRWK
jgi:hypothetical protein